MKKLCCLLLFLTLPGLFAMDSAQVPSYTTDKISFVFPLPEAINKYNKENRVIDYMGRLVPLCVKNSCVCILNIFPYNSTDPSHYTFGTGYLLSGTGDGKTSLINVPVTTISKEQLTEESRVVLQTVLNDILKNCPAQFRLISSFNYFNSITALPNFTTFIQSKKIIQMLIVHNAIDFAAIATAWEAKQSTLMLSEQIKYYIYKTLITLATVTQPTKCQQEEAKAACALWKHFLIPLIQKRDIYIGSYVFDDKYNYHYLGEPRTFPSEMLNFKNIKELMDSLIDQYRANLKKLDLPREQYVFRIKMITLLVSITCANLIAWWNF